MKLNFRVSQITNLDPEIINGLILLKLKDKEYQTLEVTSNSVTFYDNPWVPRWNFQQVRRLDGGRFEIKVVENSTSVILNYYLNILPIFLTLSGLSIVMIVNGEYDGIIFFSLFFFIAGFIQTFISKGVATEMLTGILSENIMN